MLLLHNIGPVKHNSNYNSIEEILAASEPLSFDGVYTSVFDHWDRLKGKDVKLFVTGSLVGGDNSFDTGMPLEHYCDWKQIFKMSDDGAEVGWHTWTHRDLTKLSDDELLDEVRPPFPMRIFAYPYGRFDKRVIKAVKAAGFKEAWSVTDGDGSQYQRLRKYL